MILVSPTEPAALRQLGETSPVPEWLGVDVIVSATSGAVWGIQRKRVPGDLGASISDGRLVEQLARARGMELAGRCLLLEGPQSWDGWPRPEHLRGVLLSAQVAHDWQVLWTRDLEETAAAVRQVEAWLSKTNHASLLRRPAPRGEWGCATSEEWAAHLLMGFEGVGPRKAAAILEMCDGRPPLAWTIDEKTMARAVGASLAHRLIASLEQQQEMTDG